MEKKQTCTVTDISNLTLFGEKYKRTRGFSLPVFPSITKETKNKQNKKQLKERLNIELHDQQIHSWLNSQEM